MATETTTTYEDVFGAHTTFGNIETKHVVTLALPHATDFTIHCGNRSWRVSRARLCNKSAYFKLACNGPFSEAAQDHMTLHGDDPNAVHYMLPYLMHDSYSPAFVQSALETHIATQNIADKYLLPDLQDLAALILKQCAEYAWPRGAAYDPTSAFAGAVELMYEDEYAAILACGMCMGKENRNRREVWVAGCLRSEFISIAACRLRFAYHEPVFTQSLGS
jgi:hypothetical protein